MGWGGGCWWVNKSLLFTSQMLCQALCQTGQSKVNREGGGMGERGEEFPVSCCEVQHRGAVSHGCPLFTSSFHHQDEGKRGKGNWPHGKRWRWLCLCWFVLALIECTAAWRNAPSETQGLLSISLECSSRCQQIYGLKSTFLGHSRFCIVVRLSVIVQEGGSTLTSL